MSEFEAARARLAAGYYNSQAFSGANPGGLAGDGHVTNFPSALQDLGLVSEYFKLVNDGLEAFDEDTLLTINARLAALANAQGLTNVYVDPVNGDDSRSGESFALSIKSWARLCEVIQDASAVQGFLYGDLIADTSHTVYDGIPYFALFGRDETNAFVHRKITSVDATNSGAFPGGLRVFDRFGFYFNHIDFELNTTKASGIIDARTCNVRGRFQSADFSRIGSGDARVFAHALACNGHFEFINHSVGTAGGYILTGVANGGDPNTGAFTANITAL